MKTFNSTVAAETMKQVQTNPDKGFLTISAHLDAVGGTENSVKVRDFAPLTTDEPLGIRWREPWTQSGRILGDRRPRVLLDDLAHPASKRWH